MSSEKPWTDEQTLKELYHDEDLNQSEIAEELGTSPATISNWMGKLEIETTHSSYGGTVGKQEGVECVNFGECENETPGPKNGMCNSCLDEVRHND